MEKSLWSYRWEMTVMYVMPTDTNANTVRTCSNRQRKITLNKSNLTKLRNADISTDQQSM